jgi:hypothetical protein
MEFQNHPALPRWFHQGGISVKRSNLLVSVVESFISSDEKKKKAALKAVLKKIKHREEKLKKKLAEAKGAKKKKSIEREIKATHAQRTKGIKVLRRL